MDSSLQTMAIRVGILAISVGIVTWVFLKVRQRRTRRELEARGADFSEGAAQLPVSPSPWLVSGTLEPAWSARFTDQLGFGAYPLKNGFVVLAWRSASSHPLSFVLRSAPDVGNSRHKELTPIDITGAFTYAAPASDVLAFLKGPGAAVFEAFVRGPGRIQGWTFVYDRGACYLVRYLVMENLDVMVNGAQQLERALAH